MYCVFPLRGMLWVVAGVVLPSCFPHVFFLFFRPSYFGLRSVLLPPGCRSAAPLFVISVSPQQRLASGLGLIEKKNHFQFSLGLETLSALDSKTSGPIFFLVTCENCYSSSCLTSEDCSKVERTVYEIHSHACRHSPSYQQVCIWSIQETMGIMWVRSTGSTILCNWFSKPESSEIAAHMELNCGVQPYRPSHNPLPIIQQAPWQTGGTEADNPLSKQVHIAVIAHCMSSHGSDWFCSQVSQWAEPKASAS